MLQLRVFADTLTLDDLGRWLKTSGHGQHAVLAPALDDEHSALLLAEVPGESAQAVLAHLQTLGIEPEEISLLRVDNIGPATPRAACGVADLGRHAGAGPSPC